MRTSVRICVPLLDGQGLHLTTLADSTVLDIKAEMVTPTPVLVYTILKADTRKGKRKILTTASQEIKLSCV